jgi:predicted NAD/FAD-binding protein
VAGWLNLVALVQQATRRAFAEVATYTPVGGAPVTVSGEFDERGMRVDLSTGVVVQMTGPQLCVLLSELPGGVAAVGDQVVVRGGTYTVAAPPDLDGLGQALLQLRRV